MSSVLSNALMILAEQQPPNGSHSVGWNLGYGITIVVITVVVALVAPILVIAGRIGKQAQMINEALQQSYRNTLPLAELRTTIDHAVAIIAGLERGRARLGG